MGIENRSALLPFQSFAFFFSFCSDELRKRMDKCHSEQGNHSFLRMNNTYIKHKNYPQCFIMEGDLLKNSLA